MKTTKPTKIVFSVAVLMFVTGQFALAECCTTPVFPSISPTQVVADYAVQSCCVPAPTYKVVCETVYDEKKVVRYKPVWETEIRQRPYTVSKQVAETQVREERYTVRIPVTEIEVRDCSYERVRYVPETSEREEVCTVMRPVQKVCEREEVCTVMRPVQETRMETRQSTVARQVTTYETKYVDQGAYTDQLVLKPSRGLFSHHLRFQEGKTVTDEYSGQVNYQRPGLYWTPTNKGRYEVAKIWVPNPQPVQVPRTYTVPETVCQQVPVTTTKYVKEQVVRKVPVTVTEMVEERIVKKVPYTTMKPIREMVENKVPVKVCRWKEEQRVRQVPYTSWKTVCEQRTEEYEVKVCKMIAEEQICRTPRVVQRYIPLDANGCEIRPAISEGAPVVSETVIRTEPSQSIPEPSILAPTNTDKLDPPSLSDDRNQTESDRTYSTEKVEHSVNSVLLKETPDEKSEPVNDKKTDSSSGNGFNPVRG
ncbi:MAG: hypothetical protein Q4C96_05435 [Planctomycetia bacterium]|nr:hypothetical protein [Planctomycetia bacterium]